jgi:hypothetical protein
MDSYTETALTASTGDNRSLLQCTAYHEAGHTVVAWYNGRFIEAVEIDLQSPGLGRCHTRRAYPPEFVGLYWRALHDAELPREIPQEDHQAMRHAVLQRFSRGSKPILWSIWPEGSRNGAF